MRLIALKRISGKRPKGAIFEETDKVAKFLIAARLAAAAPAEVATSPDTESGPPGPVRRGGRRSSEVRG